MNLIWKETGEEKKTSASAVTHTHSRHKNGEHEAESQLQSFRMKLNLEIWRSMNAAPSLSLTQTAIRCFQRKRKAITHTLHNHPPLNSFSPTALPQQCDSERILKNKKKRNNETPNISAKLNL